MDPQEVIAQSRQKIVEDLGIAELSETEQNAVLEEVGEVFLEKMLEGLFELVPDSEQGALQEMLMQSNADAVQGLLKKYAPDADAVIQAKLQETLAEYKVTG